MMHPSHALQTAIVSALAGDISLTALLSGAKIYENAPANAKPPWAAFDEISTRAADAVNVRGHIHRMTLRCVSDQPGTRECSAIAERICQVLSGATLTLTDHSLINMDITDMSLRRTGKIPHRVMVVTLRAMTQQQP